MSKLVYFCIRGFQSIKSEKDTLGKEEEHNFNEWPNRWGALNRNVFLWSLSMKNGNFY